MKRTFAAFVAVATMVGSLAATPVSAQRGTAAGVAAPGRYYWPAPYGASRGPYDARSDHRRRAETVEMTGAV
jgi:hypothetical protein